MLAPGAGRLLGPGSALLAIDLLLAAWVGVAHAGVEVAVAVLLAAVLVFLLAFFRDPDRRVGLEVVSAADGRVRAVERTGDRWAISVFMNVGDVHVNRAPIAGAVEAIESGGHGFRPAFRPDAERNVQRRYRLRTAIGPVEVVQITGIVARRLVSFVTVGSTLEKGERFGMIVLGSRVDVLLPADRVEPAVTPGQRVVAGVTPIAKVRP